MGPMWRDIMVVLEKCNRQADDAVDLSDAVLYTTAEPDMMCWGAILVYGIKQVVYGVKLAALGKLSPHLARVTDLPITTDCVTRRFSGGAMSKCEEMFDQALVAKSSK